jgi:hypothetical protein
VAVGKIENKSIRIVVKQLLVEMQCLSASSCWQMYIVMNEHYTVCQHSHGPVQYFFSVLQYIYAIIVFPA